MASLLKPHCYDQEQGGRLGWEGEGEGEGEGEELIINTKLVDEG